MELRKGDTVLTGTTTVNDDDSYALIYDTQDKGLTIGSNTLTVSFGGSGSLNPSTGEVTVTLEKANVNATLDGTTSKTYDGTTAAPAGLTIVLTGVQEGDDVTASSSSITYDSADAGDNRTITANGITLTGADAAYYSLISETASVETGSITAATLSGTLTITGTARYGQQLTASYDPVHEDEAVSYQWRRGGADIPSATGETYDLTAEDVGAEISVIATATDGNHTGSVTSSPVTVGKAGQDAPAEGQGCSVDFAAETVAAESGYEIAESADATEGAASLAAVPGATIYVRLAETGTHLASGWTALTLPARPAAPEVTGGVLAIKDATTAKWYARAVAWALSEGIFGGYGDGSGFGPDDPLTREQAAAVLYNAAGRLGAGADLSSFSDAGEASSWARNALPWAVSEGVLSGVELPDGSRELQPGRACTRPAPAPSKSFLRKRGTIRPRIRIFLLLSGPAG